MKNINYRLKNCLAVIGLSALLPITFSSCTANFLEYNTNPDEATDDMLDGDNFRVGAFFPQMQMAVMPVNDHAYQVSQNLTGDVYAGYMCGIGEWNGGHNGTTCDFVIDDWTDLPYEKILVSVIGADLSVKKSEGNDINNPVVAFSTILKVAAIHRLADLYGPLPYSKIAEGGSLEIEYDSEETLYNSFLSELTAAINTLTDFTKKNPGATPLADYDLVYDGDYVKWVKFANSLKLRIAMRCSYVDPELARTNAEEAVNHEYGVISGNDGNATLKSGHGLVVKNPLQTLWDTYSDCRMGSVIQSYMVGYNDPRLASYFVQSTINGQSGYWGGRTGVAITSKTKWKDFSTPKSYFTDPMVWMSAAECAFLKAEGALRGWNMGTTAAEAYETGVRLSFEEKGASNADGYLADDLSTPVDYQNLVFPAHNANKLSDITIKWNEDDSEERKLERIITQKWIALYPNGAEAWSEYRRTGYPKQFPMIDNFSKDVDSKIGPRRIPFPPSEYLLNKENVTKAISLLSTPYDGGGTCLWWDVREH